MDAYEVMCTVNTRGVEILQRIHAISVERLVADRFASCCARRLKKLAHFYFTGNKIPAQALDDARSHGHGVEVLAMIRRVAKKRLDGGDVY